MRLHQPHGREGPQKSRFSHAAGATACGRLYRSHAKINSVNKKTRTLARCGRIRHTPSQPDPSPAAAVSPSRSVATPLAVITVTESAARRCCPPAGWATLRSSSPTTAPPLMRGGALRPGSRGAPPLGGEPPPSGGEEGVASFHRRR